MTTIDPATILPWSEAKRVHTAQGPRLLRKAKPAKPFIDAWRNGEKEALKAAGISWPPGQDGKFAEVLWWQQIPAETVKAEQAKAEASRATDSAIELPCPAGLAYMGYQKAGIEYCLNIFRGEQSTKKGNCPSRGALIADEMGL